MSNEIIIDDEQVATLYEFHLRRIVQAARWDTNLVNDASRFDEIQEHLGKAREMAALLGKEEECKRSEVVDGQREETTA